MWLAMPSVKFEPYSLSVCSICLEMNLVDCFSKRNLVRVGNRCSDETGTKIQVINAI
jgi:hypothetical protein